MSEPSLKSLETHFEFGENWLDYVRQVDDAAILEAERGLVKLLPPENIKGSRFLDIGCGSGLHTLAALRMGASSVVAIDIDPNSVQATRNLLAKYAPNSSAQVKELSVFDTDVQALGLFDVVYSWGVLHHTGAMWKAVEHAANLVRPGGLFTVALYQKRLTCGAWTIEKRVYTNASSRVRATLRGLFKIALYARLALSGKSPSAYVRNYKSWRGMNFHNDVHDWLGGYPYESATPEQVSGFLMDLGFQPVSQHPLPNGLGLFGTGCAEYTFRRDDLPRAL